MGTEFICCFHWNSVNDYGVFIRHFMCDTPKYRNLYSSLGTGKCGSRELCLEVMVWHFGWTVSNLRVTLSLWKPGAIRCCWDFCNLQSVVALKTVRPLFLLWSKFCKTFPPSWLDIVCFHEIYVDDKSKRPLVDSCKDFFMISLSFRHAANEKLKHTNVFHRHLNSLAHLQVLWNKTTSGRVAKHPCFLHALCQLIVYFEYQCRSCRKSSRTERQIWAGVRCIW